MKTLPQPLIALGIILLGSMQVFTQGVVISEVQNATADPSAILDVQSGDKGFLPPRMTTAEWNAIADPANGLVVYDTDENKLFLYNGTEWVELSAAGSRWEADGDDIYRIDGNVGIGTNTPGYPLHVVTATESLAIYGQNNTSSGITNGVWGESSSTSGTGVFGVATASSGFTYGVRGQSSSTDGRGVYGLASASSGTTVGVYGMSSSSDGLGVLGQATASSGTTVGVRGHVNSPGGYAGYFTGAAGSRNYFERSVGIGTLMPNEMLEVDGNIHVSGGNRSIFNRSNNDLAFGTNNTERMRINANGNVGIGINTPGYPLHVETTTQSLAIYGQNYTGSGTTYGVFGESHSTTGRGVYGLATAGSGTTYGVHGHVNSPGGYAGYFTGPADSRNYFERSVGIGTLMPNEMLEVDGNIHVSGGNRSIFNRSNNDLAFGTNNMERMRINANGNVGIGTNTPGYPLHVVTATESLAIYGQNNTSSGIPNGVWGESSSTSGRGVVGWVTASNGETYGVLGVSNSTTNGRGVFGWATASSGTTRGVYGHVDSPEGYAGYFSGPAGSRNYFQRSVGIGINTPGYPLHVETATESLAIYGQNNASSGTTYGVFGESHSTSGRGVYGQATASSGTTYGIRGESNSSSGRGVYGLATAVSGFTYGIRGESISPSGTGVSGVASAGSGFTYGVLGQVVSTDGFAGYFIGPEGSRNYFERSVGIQTTNPGAFLLAVNGTAAKTGGGEWSVFSDARLKHSIERVQPGMLDRVLQLKGYTFEYKEHAIEKRLALPGRQIGLIAQQVREVFPEWVDSDDEGYLFITVRSLTAIMVESLRELRDEKDAEIVVLKARLLKLEDNVEKLLQQQELKYAQNE